MVARIGWLGEVLRAEGCTTERHGNWADRKRPGDFGPVGVLWHHTAARATQANPHPSLNTVINGRPDLPGPLCHVLLDRKGICHLIAGGRANHAGLTNGAGPVPAGDGNTKFVGIEIEYDGVDQDMLLVQYRQAVRATAAILRRLDRPARYTMGHKETSTTGKIDPKGVNMDDVRADVRRRLAG